MMAGYVFKQKLKAKGKSGITHTVDVVYLGGEKYIYIDLERESLSDVLSKLILSYDLGLKIYVRTKGKCPSFVEDAIKRVGGIVTS